MKKFSALAFILGMAVGLQAQSLVTDGNRWNVSTYLNFGPTETYIYLLSGDTLLGNQTYLKLYYTRNANLSGTVLIGLMREESKRVYFLSFCDNSEYLLYDFNMKEGDTQTLYGLPFPYECPVANEMQCTQIETANYFGRDYRQFHFDFGDPVWIEEIGSTEELLCPYGMQISDLSWSLLCFHHNDELAYMAPGADTCYISTVGLHQASKVGALQLSPNPVTRGQQLQVRSLAPLGQIEIYSATGTKVGSFPVGHTNNTVVDTRGLAPGVYYFISRTANTGGSSTLFLVR